MLRWASRLAQSDCHMARHPLWSIVRCASASSHFLISTHLRLEEGLVGVVHGRAGLPQLVQRFGGRPVHGRQWGGVVPGDELRWG